MTRKPLVSTNFIVLIPVEMIVSNFHVCHYHFYNIFSIIVEVVKCMYECKIQPNLHHIHNLFRLVGLD